MKKFMIGLSIGLNILWAFLIITDLLIFPSKGYGRLEKDVTVGSFANKSIVFTLPKGITVRDASAKGLTAIGQFENQRFEIVLTSNDESLVKYNISKDSLHCWDNFYSIKDTK